MGRDSTLYWPQTKRGLSHHVRCSSLHTTMKNYCNSLSEYTNARLLEFIK